MSCNTAALPELETQLGQHSVRWRSLQQSGLLLRYSEIRCSSDDDDDDDDDDGDDDNHDDDGDDHDDDDDDDDDHGNDDDDHDDDDDDEDDHNAIDWAYIYLWGGDNI